MPSQVTPQTTNADKHTNGHGKSALCSLDDFLSVQNYDYVVVGGGTAGLCVAARLTEHPNVTVGVLEAGADRMEDPQIYTPSLYPTLIGRDKYDWCFTTKPQTQAANKEYSMPRGKVLGGSSAINYLMYVRGSKGDYDAWEALGNEGWGWDDLVPYFRKHQTLDALKEQPKNPKFMPTAAKEKYHGNDGPIHTSFNDHYMPLEEDFCKAAYEVGGTEETLQDAWSGDHLGFYSSLAAVNRTTDPGRRSYAATGYLRPNLQRQNLRVLTEAHATKLILNGNTVTGVEFTCKGQTRRINATKEVIASAGVIQTPQLLELSGIGDPDVLEQAGVQCIVENRAVGENFQDHVLGGMLYELADGVKSMDYLQDPDYAAAQQKIYNETGNGPFGSPGMLMGFVSYSSIVSPIELQKTIAQAKKESAAVTEFAKAQEHLILQQLADPTFANLQTFCIPCRLDPSAGHSQIEFFKPPEGGKNCLSLLMCLEHPLSRGSVHITSSDPMKQPEIDPGYLKAEADLKILAAGIKWLDQVAQHPLMSKDIAKRVLPSSDTPLDTEEQRMEFVRNNISTQYHITGSCALGQVTDNKLRVKGVQGLRIVDASVFCMHVSGNIMSTTYAVAEKGADLIKADNPIFQTELASIDSIRF